MIRIAVFLLAVVLSSSAFAKSAPARKHDDFPKLLTSRQLLALTPARRMAYFLKLRKMLREISAMNRKGRGSLVALQPTTSDSRFDLLSKYLDSASQWLLPNASAAGCPPNYPVNMGPLCGAPCAGRDTRNDETGQAVDNTYYCFPRKEYMAWYRLPAEKRQNLQPVMQVAPDTRMPDEALAPERNAPLLAVPSGTPGSLPKIAPGAPAGEILNDPPPEEMKTTFTPSPPSNCQGNKPNQGDLIYSKCSDSWVSQSILDHQNGVMAKESEATKKNDEIKETADKIADATQPTGGATCPPPRVACTGKNHEKEKYRKELRQSALEQFRNEAPKNCVYGGNMSAYKDGEVKAGNCASVENFCAKKEDCKEDAKDVDGGFKSKYSCGKGKTLCSPFIFGLKNRSDGICVKSQGKFITENCDEEAKKLKGSAAYVGDLFRSNQPGLAEAWDEYADTFNEICKDGSTSQAAHCEECAVIAKRLTEANMMATGSCGTALHSKDVKPKSDGPPDATH